MTSTLAVEAAPNYYDVLGVAASADAAAIRGRYRALALENHPDRFDTPDRKSEAAAKFKTIRSAYEVLADVDERRRYDASLASGRPFVRVHDARHGAEPSLADIFSDVDRFPFPAEASQIADAKLRELINKNIIQSDTLKEKVIAVYKIASSNISGSTSPQVRGETASAGHLVVTNFRLLVTLSGSSTYQSGNTRHTMSYWAGMMTTLMNIDRIDLGMSAASETFQVNVYGPDTLFSGITFTLSGSVAPFLWLASLFNIPIGVSLKVPTNASGYRKAAWTSLVLGTGFVGFFVAVTDPLLWARGGIAPFFLLAPIVGMSGLAYVRCMRKAALARLFAVFGA